MRHMCAKYDSCVYSVGITNMHTIKPLDGRTIDRIINKSKIIVTVEEHSIIGGLGGAVAEYMSRIHLKPPHLILGINDEFLAASDYRYMLEKYELTGEGIAKNILNYKKEILTN